MKRKPLICFTISLLLMSSIACANTGPATAHAFTDNKMGGRYEQEAKKPGFITMTADALVLRPVLLATTIIGTGLFVVSLPFTWISKSTDQAKKILIDDPAKATFERCLGCSHEYNKT